MRASFLLDYVLASSNVLMPTDRAHAGTRALGGAAAAAGGAVGNGGVVVMEEEEDIEEGMDIDGDGNEEEIGNGPVLVAVGRNVWNGLGKGENGVEGGSS